MEIADSESRYESAAGIYIYTYMCRYLYIYIPALTDSFFLLQMEIADSESRYESAAARGPKAAWTLPELCAGMHLFLIFITNTFVYFMYKGRVHTPRVLRRYVYI